MFRVLQTAFMNNFCGSILNVCKHNISLILIGYIHRLYRSLHQSPFSMSLSTAASRRASRPLRTAAAFFVSATVSATVFPPLPLSVCVFFLLGCLSGPRTHFFAGAVPVTAVDDEVVCIERGRVGGIGGRGGIVEVEA